MPLHPGGVDVQMMEAGEVGLYKLNPVDPQLEITWFQTLEPI